MRIALIDQAKSYHLQHFISKNCHQMLLEDAQGEETYFSLQFFPNCHLLECFLQATIALALQD